MKNLTILIAVFFFSFTVAKAQGLPTPLEDKVSNEIIPEAPSADHIYVKGHYELKSGKYYWVNGAYVEKLNNSTWVDGQWVKDAETNLYSYSQGYWKNNEAQIIKFNGIAYEPGVVTELSNIEMLNNENFSYVIME